LATRAKPNGNGNGTKKADPKKDAPAAPDKSTEELSAELNEKLAEAAPKDDEQPKPKRERAKKRNLALSETEGEIKDGGKIRIGLPTYDDKGTTVTKTLVVPKTWKIVGPTARPQNVHVIDTEHPEKTLCTLTTAWTTGTTTYKAGTYITCEPCAIRMIAINKMTQAEYDKSKKEAQDKAKAEREAAVEAALEKKAAPKPAAPKAEAKPDPKPAAGKKAA
jgi:hypothetical protein